MEKSIKVILMGLVCSLSLSVFNFSVKAYSLNITDEITNVESEKSTEIANTIAETIKYGNVIAKDTLQIGNETVDLYVEFENPDLALSNLCKTYVDVFAYLQNEYNLDDLSRDNFVDYYLKFKSSLDEKNPIYKDNYDLICDFDGFYDIFENTKQNIEIINMMNELSDNLSTINLDTSEFNVELFDLAMLLPTYSNLYKQANEYNLELNTSNISTMGLTGINLSNAVTYARLNATSPNTTDYKYFLGEDCTNFASQILEAGGKSQVVTTSESTGWWHIKTVVSDRVTTHEHSISWINADKFAKYMGCTGKYAEIYALSKALNTGDFIAKDSSNDGDYNHIGFVTHKYTSSGTYTGSDNVQRTYYDFKVAQHSNNYHAYVSSNTNEWELIGKQGATVSIGGR